MAQPRNRNGINVDLVRELAELLTERNLSEIEYDSGSWRIRVARQVTTGQPAAGAVAPAPATPAVGDSDESAILAHPGLLTSPMVGVVYTSPEPGAPPYVRVGDEVEAGAPVLLIEAMKVFNTITAPRAGRVIRLFVGTGQPVEFGEPLLIIE